MSLPRRQTPAFQRVWAQGRVSGVLVFFWTMIFWGSAQALVSLYWNNEVMVLDELALNREAILRSEYWRLFTYQFLHAGVTQFAVNLLVLWFAGREIEPVVGRVQFIWLCLLSNFVGGTVDLAAGMHFPGVTYFGFSAAVAAVAAACATIMPELETRLLIFPRIAIQFRAKYLAAAVMIVAVIALGVPVMRPIGPAGILTGCLVGWVWARRIGFGNPFWFQRRAFERRQREMRIQRMTADEFLSEEIDPILEKISRDGMQSLTRSERRLLERGREKLTTRTGSVE